MHTNIHGFIRELSGPRPLCRAVDSLKTAYDLESHHSGVPLGNQPTVRTVAGEWERLLSVRLNLYRGRHPLADTTFNAQTVGTPIGKSRKVRRFSLISYFPRLASVTQVESGKRGEG